MPENKSHVYFPNLNGLRFIAAFMVIYSHIKFFKLLYGVNEYKFPIETNFGQLGVTLFFVLSGFLITYLLLEEHKRFGKIQLRFFYMRRILRIFPLYYLTVLLSFFLLPHLLTIPHFSEYSHSLNPNPDNPALTPSADTFFYSKLTLFLVFLPDVSYIVYDLVPFGSQLWSVGVEEQFYLFWPSLFILFRQRIMPVLLVIAGTIAFLPFLMDTFIPDYSVHPRLLAIKNFIYYFRIDNMAIGGMMAYLLCAGYKPFLSFVYHKITQWVVLLSILAALLFNLTFNYCHHLIYSVFFAFLILNLASNPKPILNLENAALKYLGKISYGLYIYNPLGIVISMNICLFLFNVESLFFNICLFILSVAITVLLSSLSYHLFEEKFLKLKPRFSKILSNK